MCADYTYKWRSSYGGDSARPRSDFIYTKNSARPRSDFIYTKNSARPGSGFSLHKESVEPIFKKMANFDNFTSNDFNNFVVLYSKNFRAARAKLLRIS